MDQTTLAAQQKDAARLEAITKCETQIEEGKRRGRDAIRIIAKALNKIRSQELFLDRGYATFNSYVEGNLRMDRHVASRIMQASEVILTLENAGIEITQIPAVEDQLVILHRIPQEDLAQTWVEGLQFLEEKGLPVNSSNIKRIVDIKLSQLPPAPGTAEAIGGDPSLRPGKGVNPALSIAEEEEQEQEEERRVFSEAAELALERIGRLTSQEVAQAILSGTLAISDRDLVRWADESDQMVKTLQSYIVDERWTVGKALAYESAMITEHTSLEALARLATARGGSYETEAYIGNANWAIRVKKQ